MLNRQRGAVPRSLTRICTSLSAKTCDELVKKAKEAFTFGTDLVEFRIDRLRTPELDEIRSRLSPFGARSVFTVRPKVEGGGFGGGESERLRLIRGLSDLDPAYLDVELSALEASPDFASEMRGFSMIVSWHDSRGTPDRERLLSVMSRAKSYGGRAKVVTTAKRATDNMTILSLYHEPGPPPIAFSMGERGLFSRMMSMVLGSPIAYACLPGAQTADGQLALTDMLLLRRRLDQG